MGKIFYSLAGEGRGHATRVQTIVDSLSKKHSITIFAPNHAYDLLKPLYKNAKSRLRGIRLVRIPGLSFHYNSRKELDYIKTAYYGLRYYLALPRLIHWIKKKIAKEKPDLIISDFDPALPRAARKMNLSFISLDHQHFLSTYDLSSLPWHLKLKTAMMAIVVNIMYAGQKETIVSSFYFPPLRKGIKNTRQIGVLIRNTVRDAQVAEGDYLLAYLRRFAGQNILDSLRKSGKPVKIYGLGAKPAEGNLEFKKVDNHGFVQDLAGCRALITTAGNQVIGEALYLKKPVLAMPESKNFEQEINGHFIRESGTGLTVGFDELSPEIMHTFLDNLDEYKNNISSYPVYGNNEAVATIENHLYRAKEESRKKAREIRRVKSFYEKVFSPY